MTKGRNDNDLVDKSKGPSVRTPHPLPRRLDKPPPIHTEYRLVNQRTIESVEPGGTGPGAFYYAQTWVSDVPTPTVTFGPSAETATLSNGCKGFQAPPASRWCPSWEGVGNNGTERAHHQLGHIIYVIHLSIL